MDLEKIRGPIYMAGPVGTRTAPPPFNMQTSLNSQTFGEAEALFLFLRPVTSSETIMTSLHALSFDKFHVLFLPHHFKICEAHEVLSLAPHTGTWKNSGSLGLGKIPIPSYIRTWEKF